MNFSKAKTDNVVGQIQAKHNLPRPQLQAVVEDALRAALIYDHGQRAMGDSADTKPPAQDSDSRARDEMVAAMKNQYQTKKGTGGGR